MSGGEVIRRRSRMILSQELRRVKILVEGCLRQYMDKYDTVENLMTEADVNPTFTEMVWEELKKQNKEFFRAYSDRLMLRKQISVFNWLLALHVNTVMRQSRVASVSPLNGHTMTSVISNNVLRNTIPSTAIVNHRLPGNQRNCVCNNGLIHTPMMETSMRVLHGMDEAEIHSQLINSSVCTSNLSGKALNDPVTDVEMPLLEPLNQDQLCFGFSDRTVLDMYERCGMLPVLPSEVNNLCHSPAMELNDGQEDFSVADQKSDYMNSLFC